MIRVSIVIPAYNVAAYIEQAVDSALRQSLRELEVIVVDDASTDETAAIVERLAEADPRVRLVRSARNGGVCRARNAALDLAQGAWAAMLDSDDWMDERRLEVLVGQAESAGLDWIADDQRIVEDGTHRDLGRLLRGEPSGLARLDLEHLIDRDPPETFGYGTLKPVIRRAFLERHAIRYRLGHERFEDFLLTVDCALAGARMGLLNEPLYGYRRRQGSLISLDTRRTLESMLRQNDTALAAANAVGAVGASEALRRRERLIRRALRYRRVVDPLKEGRAIASGRALARDPFIVGDLLRGLGRSLAHRTRRLVPHASAVRSRRTPHRRAPV